MRLVLLCACVLCAACATAPASTPTTEPVAEKTSPPPPPAETPAAAAETDCTLATELVPGIPGSPGHLFPSDINPNGASELAVLMRTMQSELGKAKEAIENGASFPTMYPRFKKMRCAWPTAAADRNQQFDTMAQVYLAQVKALDEKPADLHTAFNNVITGCVSCHEISCAGPIEAIEKLRLAQVP
jgi:hypothetical protein